MARGERPPARPVSHGGRGRPFRQTLRAARAGGEEAQPARPPSALRTLSWSTPHSGRPVRLSDERHLSFIGSRRPCSLTAPHPPRCVGLSDPPPRPTPPLLTAAAPSPHPS